jgi:O-antigen ligase
MEFLLPYVYFLQPGILWPELAEWRPIVVLLALAFAVSLARTLPGVPGLAWRHPAWRWLCLFVLIQGLSVYRAGFALMVDEFLFLGVLLMFPFVSVRLVTDEARLWRYVTGSIAGAMCVVIFGLRAVALQLAAAVGGRAGAYGMYENHNDYTFIILMILPFIVACYRLASGVLLRTLMVGCGVACVAGVFLSLSRGGILALMLEAVLLLWVSAKRWQLVVLMPVVLAVGVVAVKYQFDAREANQGSVYTAEDAENSRMELWRAGIAMVRANPLLGIGSRQFGDLSQNYGEISGDNIGKNAHNTFIEVAATTGLIGLAAFLTMLWQTFRHLRRRPGQDDSPVVDAMRGAALAALVAIAFRALFDSKEFDFSFYFLVAIAVMCSVLREARTQAAPGAPGAPPPEGRRASRRAGQAAATRDGRRIALGARHG